MPPLKRKKLLTKKPPVTPKKKFVLKSRQQQRDFNVIEAAPSTSTSTSTSTKSTFRPPGLNRNISRPFTSKTILPSVRQVLNKYEHDQFPGTVPNTTKKPRTILDYVGVSSSGRYVVNNLGVSREAIYGGTSATKLSSETALVKLKMGGDSYLKQAQSRASKNKRKRNATQSFLFCLK